MAHSDQLHPFVHEPGKRGGVELAVAVVGDDDNLGAGALGGLPVGQHVAAVFRAAGEDPVTRTERHRVEGGVPGMRGIIEKRHLVGLATQQPSDAGVGGADRPSWIGYVGLQFSSE